VGLEVYAYSPLAVEFPAWTAWSGGLLSTFVTRAAGLKK
jgi:hypothetical protein